MLENVSRITLCWKEYLHDKTNEGESRDIEAMLFQFCATVHNADPTLKQPRFSVPCLSGLGQCITCTM